MSQKDPFAPFQTSGGTPKRVQRRPSVLGCFITALIVLSIVGGIGVGIAAVVAPDLLNGLMTLFTGIETAQTRAVEGDAAAFDPIAAYESIAAFAGEGAQLVSFEAYYVRADGTLDLTATYTPSPRVTAEYVVEVARPDNAPPPGVAGAGGDKWYQRVIIEAYQPGQRRTVTQTGGGISTRYSYVNEGMTRDVRSTPSTNTTPFLPAPRCAFREMWAVALERGAPADAVAVIEYDEEGYEFEINIPDRRVSLDFDNDCALIE